MSIATTIAPVTTAQLHSGIGACNRASIEAPGHWRARASELLSEQFGPATVTAILARVEALQALLASGPCVGAYDGPGGAVNVLPALFDAAAVAPLNGEGFDSEAIEALCGGAEKKGN